MLQDNSDDCVKSKYFTVPLEQEYLDAINVTVSTQRQGKHVLTQIIGLNDKDFNLKVITSDLKKLCGGGGTFKEIRDKDDNKVGWCVTIQGKKIQIVKQFLIECCKLSDYNIRVLGYDD